MLYISIGDGQVAEPPDVKKTGQFIGDVFSSVLRISVEGQTNGMHYLIPADNPFVNTPSARGEVWAYGLRNPCRMSFDDATGNLWLGDVGWYRREMIHLVVRGENYGWSTTEGREILDVNGNRGQACSMRNRYPAISHAPTVGAVATVRRLTFLPTLTRGYCSACCSSQSSINFRILSISCGDSLKSLGSSNEATSRSAESL